MLKEPAVATLRAPLLTARRRCDTPSAENGAAGNDPAVGHGNMLGQLVMIGVSVGQPASQSSQSQSQSASQTIEQLESQSISWTVTHSVCQ